MYKAGLVLSLWLLCVPTIASAGVSILGFEIGTATLPQVRSTLAKSTTVEDAGVNKWSGGSMLRTDGRSYGIEGLTSVLYIFDADQKLVAVDMDMAKDRFDAIYDILAAKYKVVASERPFVGDRYARFKSGDVTIIVDAPHLSFHMAVTYGRDDFWEGYHAGRAKEAKEKKAGERSKF